MHSYSIKNKSEVKNRPFINLFYELEKSCYKIYFHALKYIFLQHDIIFNTNELFVRESKINIKYHTENVLFGKYKFNITRVKSRRNIENRANACNRIKAESMKLGNPIPKLIEY